MPKDTTPNADPNAELPRTFQEATSDPGVANLQAIMSRVESLPPEYPTRPELRRPRLAHPCIYRLHIDLDGARPPIWRRLDVRADLTLDVVHQVIQAAFGWYDYHLHRFALGAGPFSPNAQLFLCPHDVEEADPADEGLPATEVHLDETMQEPGDVLRYIYDYGDSWHLTLRLEEVMPAADVEAACLVVPEMRNWRSKHNREVQAYPLLRFRESLQRLGLLRKHKGRLLLTRAGAAAQRDPALLWEHLAERLIPSRGKPYDLQATLLLLFYAATSPGQALSGRPIAAAALAADALR